MTDLRHAEELAQKYFDEIISPAEMAELEALLVSDADVARVFNQIAKTDHLIHSHYNACRAEIAAQLEPVPMYQPAPLPDIRQRTQRTWKKIRDRLWGPTGAVIFHVVILLVLFRLATFNPPPKETEYEITFEVQKNTPLDSYDPPLDVTIPVPNLPNMVDVPEMPSDVESLPEIEDQAAPNLQEDPGLSDVSMAPSPLIMKNFNPGRTEGGRLDALGQYAGGLDRFTEPAVIKALEWLKKSQAADGSWGPNKPAMTGLALLTFLAHGATPSSEPYGQTVEKAIRFLGRRQDLDGRFCQIDQPGAYAHAIAAYAVSEAFGLTRIPSLKPVMEKSIQVILDGQQAGGGWDYDYKKTARRDTSVAGWQIQALKAACMAGAENAGLREALDKAAGDLKRAQDAETGRFFYTDKSGHKTDSITGIAVLCLLLTGNENARETKAGLQALAHVDCNWEKPPAWPLYAWYYITQARFHQGGSAWARWNNHFARVYVKNQNEDGSWTSPGAQAGRETGNEVHLGPVYSTTLAALTLQVYYRFLPTYKTVTVKPEETDKTNDVTIQLL